MFNISEHVSDRIGSVLFVKKDGQYHCSESWLEAYRLIFQSKAALEYIDLDGNYSTTRVDVSADAENHSIRVLVPAECGCDTRYLEIIYTLADGISATEVPTELSEEIVEIRDEVAGLKGEETIKHAAIPDYVKAEALRVAQQVQSVRKDDSIVFLAMSDNHHYGDQGDAVQYPNTNGIQTNVSNLHAAMAAKILTYALDLDFIAQLGDYAYGGALTTSKLLHSQVAELTGYYRDTYVDMPVFHAIGNHDTGYYYHEQMVEEGHTGVYTESGEWLYDNFTALSDSEDTVFGGQSGGGYCYRDFADKKVRVFLLNPCEGMVETLVDSGASGAQRAWFADALIDLNSKTDAADWKIIVLTHYPADFATTMPLSDLIKAYVEGSSITITLEDNSTRTFDFFGSNSARLIANIHGHIHNFKADKLYSSASGSTVQYDAWRISIPNGQFNRENCSTTAGGNADITYAEPIKYLKTPDSAKDTSFVVNVINPTEQEIYSICYGAGRDRLIGYGETVYYPVLSSATSVILSGQPDYIKAGDPLSVGVTPVDGCVITDVQVTMGGTDVTDTVYVDNAISISAVIGEVVIIATAIADLNVTNQIPISTDDEGNIYNGIGYKSNTYIQTNGDSGISGYYATGYIPCVAGDVIRFHNMSFVKGDGNCRLAFYDADKTLLKFIGAASTYFMESLFKGVLDGDNYVEFTIKADAEMTGMAYIRVCCARIAGDSILTVNEEIT